MIGSLVVNHVVFLGIRMVVYEIIPMYLQFQQKISTWLPSYFTFGSIRSTQKRPQDAGDDLHLENSCCDVSFHQLETLKTQPATIASNTGTFLCFLQVWVGVPKPKNIILVTIASWGGGV